MDNLISGIHPRTPDSGNERTDQPSEGSNVQKGLKVAALLAALLFLPLHKEARTAVAEALGEDFFSKHLSDGHNGAETAEMITSMAQSFSDSLGSNFKGDETESVTVLRQEPMKTDID